MRKRGPQEAWERTQGHAEMGRTRMKCKMSSSSGQAGDGSAVRLVRAPGLGRGCWGRRFGAGSGGLQVGAWTQEGLCMGSGLDRAVGLKGAWPVEGSLGRLLGWEEVPWGWTWERSGLRPPELLRHTLLRSR